MAWPWATDSWGLTAMFSSACSRCPTHLTRTWVTSWTSDVVHRAELLDHRRVNPVEQAREDRFRRLPDDAEDQRRDHQTNQRVGHREPQPDAQRPSTTARLVSPSVRA